MSQIYLFDWGDTLMVDFPESSGKMCDWKQVQAVEGAADALKHLSQLATLYVATGAADSSETEIRTAFECVGLDRYLSGYFCQANLGASKGTPAFLPRILQHLNAPADQVTVVGDSFDKDIVPALAIGINAIWLTTEQEATTPAHPALRKISSLQALCLE
ncbi:MAG: HAD family hydrolase [Halopseudomonas sp.]